MSLSTAFSKLMRQLLADYGASKGRFANAAGISPSQLSRFLRPRVPHDTQPSIEVCLRIAHSLQCSASRVLRAAGRSEAANLLEYLYGAPAERRMNLSDRVSLQERKLLLILRTLPIPVKRAIQEIFDALQTGQVARQTADFKRTITRTRRHIDKLKRDA